jgi:hypothetical protein
MPPFAGLAAAGNAGAQELGQRQAPSKQDLSCSTVSSSRRCVATILGAATFKPVAIISGRDVLLQEFSIRIVICPVHVRAAGVGQLGNHFLFYRTGMDYFVRSFLLFYLLRVALAIICNLVGE